MAEPLQSDRLEAIRQQIELAADEIANRNTSQFQLSVAGLAGLGVLASQIHAIEGSGLTLVYLGVAIIYALLAILILEQDHRIYLCGRHRDAQERELGSIYPSNSFVGWEQYKSASLPSGWESFIASLAKYGITAGTSIGFYVRFLRSPNNYEEFSGPAWISAVVLLIVFISSLVPVTKGWLDERRPEPQSG